MSSAARLKIAYLISRYPAVSHTFIMREIRALRALGFDIPTASINSPEPCLEKLPPEEKLEAQSTFYIKQEGAWQAIQIFFILLLTSPIRLINTLVFCLYLGGADLKKLLYHFFYLGEAMILGRWLQKEKITHLHVHFANPAASVALLTSKLFPCTYSMTVHGPDEFYDVPGYRLLEKIENARFICCISFYAQSQLMKITPPTQWPKFEIAPLGVDSTIFDPAQKINGRRIVELICVGRLVPAKGQHILIAAISSLIKQGIPLHLTIVGDGIERENLEKAVAHRELQNHITFRGSLTQTQVLDCYKNSDIFVLPSFAEGVPISLMEAMSMEIPCVATDVNGVPELIRNEIDGILTHPSDVEGLTETLADLIKNSDARELLGKAGRRRIAEKYQLNQNVEYLAKIFVRRLTYE